MQPTIAIIGSSGLVGEELQKFFTKKPPLLFSRSKTPVEEADFSKIDLAFFCAGSEISKLFIPKALECGCRVIDSSSAFRQDPSVPLVIPEINAHLLKTGPRLIASPNCTASIMLMALYPLEKAFGIERVIASSYQAASGAGKRGLEALQSSELIVPFPHPLKHNLFLHESPQDEAGFSEEEKKAVFEIEKILERDFPVHIRCVRVPVERAHSISLYITLKTAPSKQDVDKALSEMEGLQLNPSPNPLLASHQDIVFTTPSRIDPKDPRSISLFVAGDQLRKGAALNAFQIALHLERQ